MKICSLYGVGFYYVPGTDMCLKLGGWARYEQGYGYNSSFTTEFFNNNLNNRSTNDNNWRVKGVISVDARDQTPFGTVRSYVAIGTSNNNTGSGDAGVYIPRWFIQWAGWTFGNATSFYDFYSIGANQYGFITASSDTGDGGWNVLGYTWQFGNGVSATLSAEVQHKTYIENQNTGFLVFRAADATSVNYRGHDYPDLVANIHVDQAWGSAQIMGALHQVSASYYSDPSRGGAIDEWGGHPGDKMGFAVGGGMTLKLPMLGQGDNLTFEADYTQGALRYTNNTAVIFDFAKYDGDTVGYGKNADAVYGGTVTGGTASALELTTAWNVNAAITHYWNPQWRSTLWGSYREVSFNGAANAMLCAGEGSGTGTGLTAVANPGCSNDWTAWGLGLKTEWLVSKNFLMGLEVLYGELNSATTSTGTIALAANGTKPAQTYVISDQDQWAVRFRVNRNFFP